MWSLFIDDWERAEVMKPELAIALEHKMSPLQAVTQENFGSHNVPLNK